MEMNNENLMTEDRQRIQIDHYKNGFDKVLILVPGFFNSKQAVLFRRMAEALGREYDVIVMDLRGHGRSGGHFTWSAKEHLDLAEVLVYAKKYYGSVGVIGFSLGGAVSIVTAARSGEINSLISVSAPTQFNRIDYHFWRMDVEENVLYNIFKEGRRGKGVRPGPLWLKKTSPADVVSDIKIPVFFIHGEDDWIIRPWHARSLYEKASGEKELLVLPGMTHAEYMFRRDPEKIVDLFFKWFRKTL